MTIYIHTTDGTTADAEGTPPATAYAAGRWWDLRTLDPAALAACGWHPLTTTTRPTDTPTTTTDRCIVNQAGTWTETWTVRAWTTDELTAQARLANADTLTTQARTAIAGNQAAITAATTGQIATFKALTDTITGTLANTQTAVGQNRQAIDWCIDQITRLQRQNIALIRTLGQILPALTDLLDTLDGTT